MPQLKSENLNLPLLQAAQAQKHITVNEALIRLDHSVQLVIQEERQEPPSGAQAGSCFIVGEGALWDWSGHESDISYWDNGKWAFISPKKGWFLWEAQTERWRYFDGTTWGDDPSGRGSFVITHGISAGEENIILQGFDQVKYVRSVYVDLSGVTGAGLTSWSLGIGSKFDAFLSFESLNDGVYEAQFAGLEIPAHTPLTLTADTGEFSGGTLALRLAFQ